jgi:hypothetical protein
MVGAGVRGCGRSRVAVNDEPLPESAPTVAYACAAVA